MNNEDFDLNPNFDMSGFMKLLEENKVEPNEPKERIFQFGVIYKWTNIKTKQNYIGQSWNPENRFDQFYRFSNKYGGEKINKARLRFPSMIYWRYSIIDVIIAVEKVQSQIALDSAEMYYIKQFNSLNDGYNSNGGGGGKFTNDGIKRLSYIKRFLENKSNHLNEEILKEEDRSKEFCSFYRWKCWQKLSKYFEEELKFECDYQRDLEIHKIWANKKRKNDIIFNFQIEKEEFSYLDLIYNKPYFYDKNK